MQRFRNILVVADEGSVTDAVIARARWLAEANAATLKLIDIVEAAPGGLARVFGALPGGRGHEIEARVIALHRDRLEALATPLRADGLPVETRVIQGTGFIETIRHVLEHGNDLVLKGAHRAPERAGLRGPDLHLLRKCPCPVWILNGAAEPRARRIMAAVEPDPDDSVRDALNHMVMELATSLARRDGASLDVVNAWHVPEESALRHSIAKIPEADVAAIVADAERQSASRLRKLTADFARFDDMMRIIHIKGIPADVLTEHADTEEIDTLVMGTLGRTGVAGFFIGNTAETVLNRVGCSVLAVKPRGFVSPVTLDGGRDGEGTDA